MPSSSSLELVCLRSAPWLFVFASLASAGCESRVALGGMCASGSDCQSPYVFRASRCRVECADDTACGATGRCVLTAPGVGGCSGFF